MEKLKKQRGVIKGRITRVKSFLDLQLAALTSTTEELVSKLELLERAWEEYNSTYSQIVEFTDDDQTDVEEADYVDIENKFCSSQSGLRTLIKRVESASSSSSSSLVSDLSGSLSSGATSSSTVASVKLPRMDLPTFTGNQLEWQSFRDLFKSIVHSNAKISDSQKLHYLKNSLRDEADGLLQSIDITDANNKVAWDLLCDRYENQRQLIHCHMKTLFAQPTMSTESASHLRKLLDTTSKHVRAFEAVGVDITNWDPIITFILTDRLDQDSRRQWELNSPGKTYPKLDELKVFLEQRCRALEASSNLKPKHFQKSINSSQSNQKQTARTHHLSTQSSCPVCNSNHFIYQCGEFSRLNSKEKGDLVKKLRLCFNCLRSSHVSKDCKSQSTCRHCKKKHNTLLHMASSIPPSGPEDLTAGTTKLSSNISSKQNGMQILLATVVINVMDSRGKMQQCRALMDPGSQANLITEDCMTRLGIRREKSHISISGIGQHGPGISRGIVSLTLQSRVSLFTINIDAFILTTLTTELPNSLFNYGDWSYIKELRLADENFNRPGPIDIIIGAEYYEDIIKVSKIAGPEGMPTARNTHFGWMLMGKVENHATTKVVSCSSTINLSDQLKLFWELEEVNIQRSLSTQEEAAENHFSHTHTRNSNGRYVISLPFHDNSNSLGLSKEMCLRRLQSVERRLEKYPHYKEEYDKFMNQYEQLGHMEPIPLHEQPEVLSKTNYLPHHFVLKESSSTTSFRVVFDGSAKTTNGVSLNNQLLIGPQIQDDIYSILMRFRLHKYAFTADIAKMYRQIQVNPSDADLQRILWRKHSSMPIQEFRLTTVTYGTAAAPFLATRVLQQLAHDNGNQYPLAKQIVLKDFYVDDVMSGSNSLETALQQQQQLIDMMRVGGFQLRKWSANHNALLESLPPEYRETDLPLSIESNDTIKALGLHWSPAGDFLFFKVNLGPEVKTITKRSILSETARLFDPLGWLSPVIIIAKTFLQNLWLLAVSWDEELSTDISSEWLEFRNQLIEVENLKLDRFVSGDESSTYQLHGFSDASQQSYAAVIFLRTHQSGGTITVQLLTSKTRVSPVRQVSIPRLELCGATVLAQLMDKVTKALKINIESTYYWTDSTVTLAWISQHPAKWVTFVANRVSEIQSLTSPSSWRHVPSADNPADCASRGMLPINLLDFSLWWNGPVWLKSNESNWPISPNSSSVGSLPDQRKVKVLTTQVKFEWNLVSQYSSLTRLKRVTAYCLRFINNVRAPVTNRITTSLTTSELQQALLFWITQVQRQEFADTLSCLTIGKVIPNQLASLSPFIDQFGVLRVGGRLRHSSFPVERKHPILLPKNHHLTRILINEEHRRLLHAGSQLTLSSLQQKYWIINGRCLIRHLIHKCVKCVRDRSATLTQRMGDLPSHRVQPARPFLKSGVDYAGPFMLKSMKGRGGKLYKAYISLFVCMTTKASHIELVTDLTTDAFLGAFKRFVSRRGRPSDIFSDNGTNFVGANSELKDLFKLVSSQTFNQTLANELSKEGVNWHFNPAKAPHFGGIWEAGIKAVKTHLRRVVGDQILTFEELYTVLTQVEACINSRPLCPMTTDPNDLSVLTPGHFIIGEPLTAIPEPDLTYLKVNRLSRWQLVQQLTQNFWKRWHTEYLSQLYQRSKWKTQRANINVGDLVLIKEDNIPPQKWLMGRVSETHPGKDKLIRAVTLKTKTGILKRPIVKLCLLLPDESEV